MHTNFVKFVPIDDEGKSFESDERRYSDEVFINRPIHNNLVDDNITRNEYFGRPSYTRHVFSNMGANLYCLDERNVATPIEVFTSITDFGLKYLREHDINESHGQGVYIVERYNIYDITAVNVKGLINYYRQVSDLTEETIRQAEKNLFKCTPSNGVTMRVITYIPKRDINYYKYIYSPKTNLCVVKGTPHANVSHPRAVLKEQSKEKLAILEDDHSTVISIDITDSNNPYKPYYMVIGNNVERIISTPSTIKPNGAKVYIKKDHDILNDKTDYGIGELAKAGIYDTEDKAIYKGDMSAILEKKKYDLEDSKLEINKRKILQENNKIELSYKQIGHDEYMQKLEREIKILNYQAVVFKAEYEYNMSLLNMERENMLFQQKMEQDNLKAIGTYVNLSTLAIKTFTSLI